MELITFKITGTSPLLMNNPVGMLNVKPDTLSAAKKIYDPNVEAQSRLYKDDKGFFLPSVAFRSAILSATSGKKVGKEKAIFVIPSSVQIAQENTYLVDKKGKSIQHYEIDSRRVVVMKAGVIRHRPKFLEWQTYLPLLIDTDRIPEDSVLTLLNDCGQKIGVGDYRPNKKGWFGMFKAEIE